MVNVAHLDFESRSACDIRKSGAYVYWEHPTTEPTMLAWSLDDGPVRVWLCPTSTMDYEATARVAARLHTLDTPRVLEARKMCEDAPADWLSGGPMPPELHAALADPSVMKKAHNAGFERLGCASKAGARIGLPQQTLALLETWDCTAARAAAICLPRALGNVTKALRMSVEKDDAGHRLMLQMCKPRKARKKEDPSKISWWEDDDRLIREAAYCRQDVVTEKALDTMLPALRPEERETWELTERMNDRGVMVDRALVDAVLVLTAKAETAINADLRERTGGAVPAVTDHGALTRWLVEQGVDDAADTGVDKAAIAAMLENEDLDPLVREVLCIRQDGGGSSSKKWHAILRRTSADGRLRGALVYCGASSTGRWASTGAQLQNLPSRVSLKDTDGAMRDVLAGADPDVIGMMHGPPLVVASCLLRPAFMAPPNDPAIEAMFDEGQAPRAYMARGDYSQIEARVNPWLAGAEWKLDAFRAYDAGTGPDLYCVGASGIYGRQISKKDPERQTGKVSELALGFGGGAGALQNMAKAYSLIVPKWPRRPNGMPLDQRERPDLVFTGTDEWIKRMWRKANPEIVGLWLGLEVAAVECMSRPVGDVVEVWTLRAEWIGGERILTKMFRTPLKFTRNTAALVMWLPSGRPLLYWWPRLQQDTTPFGEKWTVYYYAEDSVTKQWRSWSLWGGIACENAVQAVARDIMRDALIRMYRKGILPVLTVHDEGIAEVIAACRDLAARVVEEIMREPCLWAPGLPISADSSAGPRYVKA